MTNGARDDGGTSRSTRSGTEGPVEAAIAPSSYRAVAAVPGFTRIMASALLARTASQMYSLVLVLFVLARFKSPQLAGVAVLCSILPGLALSPIAGAVLDRGARVRLVVLDYVVGAAAMTLLSVLALTHHLGSVALLVIVAAGSITQPLSNAGLRSVFPLIVPRTLWDRVNAVDSGAYLVATVVGPGVGGAAVAIWGPTAALLVPGVALALGASILIGITVPSAAAPATSMIADAWEGLLYVVRNRVLRMLAIMVSIFNIGGGVLTVALPVLVIRRLHGGSTETGALFAVLGVAGIASGFVTGRFNSEGRERTFMIVGSVISAFALALLAVARTPAVAALVMAALGLANGPLDLGLFSLRQRSTDPSWFGRAFAVSMSLNYLGIPLGAALAGPIVDRSITGALMLGAVLAMVAAAVPYADLRRGRRGRSASSRGVA